MQLAEYRATFDAKFAKQETTPPQRLHPKYFDGDGSATSLLKETTQRIETLWPEVSSEEIQELYVLGGHAEGSFHKHSDFDIGLLVYVDYFEAQKLRRRLNALMIGRGTPAYDEAKRRYDAGERDFIDCQINIVKPFGRVYDLREHRWITFGKTRAQHEEFVRDVLGLNPELFI